MTERRGQERSGPTACVLAPAPLLTVTVEQVGDDTELHIHAGGQGYWIARLMVELGVAVRLCATFGGETGRVARHLLVDDGLDVVGIEVAAANGGYVHDRRSGERREVAAMSTGALTRHEVDELYGAVLTVALDADVTVLGGPGLTDVLPGDVYRRLAADLGANGCTVVADLSRAWLDGVVEGRAAVIKVSHEELVADGRSPTDDPDDLVAAIRGIAASTGGAVVCSRAEAGALAVVGDRVLSVTSPTVEPVESRGAGDSFTAGLATAYARGATLEDALRLGAAAGALNVTRRGLGTGQRDQVEAVAAHVEIAEVGSGDGRG